jgi:hypothetical protein
MVAYCEGARGSVAKKKTASPRRTLTMARAKKARRQPGMKPSEVPAKRVANTPPTIAPADTNWKLMADVMLVEKQQHG